MKNPIFLSYFRESEFQEAYNRKIWPYIIITITIVSFVIGNFSISQGNQELFSFLFFIPIILTAYYFPKQGIIVSFAVGAGYIILNGIYLMDQPLLMSRALLTSAIFFGIGGLISILSENLTGLKRKYREIIDLSEAGILLIDAGSGVITESNPAFQRMVGFSAFDLNNSLFSHYWLDTSQYRDTLSSIRDGRSYNNFVGALVHRNGDIHEVLISGRIFDGTKVLFTLIDISEQVRVSRELENSENQYRQLVETAEEGVVVCDLSGTILFANRKTGSMLGCCVTDLIHSSLFSYARPGDRPILETIFNRSESRHKHEIDLVDETGVYHPVILSTSLLSDSQATNTPRILALVSDITERKQYEEQLKQSVREKEILIQEIHHRVKNNMSVICSLLQLDSLQTDDTRIQERLWKTESRVKSMALVHEKLYQSKETGSVDFNDYVRSLVADVITFSGKEKDVVVHQDIEDINLDLDQAMPCGLIINELLTNSIKHAFSDKKSGNIFISGRYQAGFRYSLDFFDDGSGIPEDTDAGERKTLGMRLIRVLVKQIDGTFEAVPGKGASFRFTFPTRTMPGINSQENPY